MRSLLMSLIILFPTSVLAQPFPPGGGYGIFTPAGPYNLAGQCLYFHQASDSDTYLCRSAANEVTQTCGGVAIFVCNASGCDLAGELGSVSSLDATTESTIEAAIDTLNNVSSIGTTTESTIEAAIDTLANLTSVQGQTISLSGGLTVESSSTVNQDLTTDANVQFNQVTLGNTGLVVGSSTPFSDSSGTLTFQNIDALDATTETTIEGAIDTLGDLSIGSIAQGDDKSVCQGADTDFCCEWDTDGTEGLLCTATDCDGIGTDCDPILFYQSGGAPYLKIDSVLETKQGILLDQGDKICLNGATCTAYIQQYDATTMHVIIPTTLMFGQSPGAGKMYISNTDNLFYQKTDQFVGYIYNSGGILQLGGAITTSRGYGTGNVGIANNLEVDGEIGADGRILFDPKTIVADDTTPDVSGGYLFYTSDNTGATAITDLDNPGVGQTMKICIGGTGSNASTITDGGNFNLEGNWTPGVDDCITLCVQADNDYIECAARVNN